MLKRHRLGSIFPIIGGALFMCAIVVGVYIFSNHRESCEKETIIEVEGYKALDADNPVKFYGTYIEYAGERITLGEKAIFVDGGMSNELAENHSYVYNDFIKAMEAVRDGTEEEPMKVYIAPYVYWIDNPDDEEIRVPQGGDIPYGLIIDCEWLSLIGLTDDPYNVVLAVNRGQTQGAKGNYTMFYFNGKGTRTENLTMGNYCNVDLEYNLKPELSREKRADAITQAQLALTNGDKIVAVNCNFISRLNSCPFVGTSGRILFKDCHIECTDDALPGTAVFLGCSFGFYSSKPFYSTQGSGAVFLDCLFDSKVKGTQYLTKAGGTVALIDCEFTSGYKDFKVEWTPEPDATLRCNQANVTVNGRQILVSADNPYNTVDLTGTQALKAYKVELEDGRVIYNTYNLLKGSDEWDPLDNRVEINGIAEAYAAYPVAISTVPLYNTVKTGESGIISYKFKYFRNAAGIEPAESITWQAEDAIKDYVNLTSNPDGTCSYSVVNTGLKSVSGMIYASGRLGFKTGMYITIVPEALKAPGFVKEPVLTIEALEEAEGDVVKVNYELDTDGRDISEINWYRCDDKEGNGKVIVAVTRLDEPEYEYKLTLGDAGYYIMAEITPKEEGSKAGEKICVVTERAITADDRLCKNIVIDFQNMPVVAQNEIREGFFTLGGYKPADTSEYDWRAVTGQAWIYGEGEGGATGTGLLQSVRGARLLYTPVSGNYDSMSVKLVADPCKSAGQGFGSATAQYMDVYIKFDTHTLTGYALRIERTAKYSNAVDFTLMKYKDGVAVPISESVSGSCYNASCTISLTIRDGRFSAHVETTHEQSEEQKAAGLLHVVDLSADIEMNEFGGSGVMHTGTVGANATMLHELSIIWD